MVLLVLANGVIWIWAWAAFNGQPALIAAALLAYGLGLRHALDADHIAAIDNTTRKMMEAGRRPVTLGLFFSLGHSAVVFLLTCGVVIAAASFASLLAPVRAVLSVVGATLSLLFLVAVASLNLVTLVSIWSALRHQGEPARAANALAPHGLMTYLLAPVSRCVTQSWHMFFVGFLFGLSFETASEISLLSLSVSQMTNGLSPGTVLVFPALFAAGMSLLDAADGIMMIGVYGWALARPTRRLVYNLIITTLSVVVALLIAGLGLIGLLAKGGDAAEDTTSSFINIDMTTFGCAVVASFAVAWLIAAVLNRRSNARQRCSGSITPRCGADQHNP
jgi:high-affinity nickel-transport protein